MSDLQEDPTWRNAARDVARELDRNHMDNARDLMRQDLYQLQNDPKAQHDFINMVNRYEHKGIGADFQIQRGPQGQEQWNILPPNYGRDGRYQTPVPQPMPYPQQPDVVIIEPQRPSLGEKVVEGVVTGVGIGVGIGVMDKIFNGGHDNHRRRR